MNHSIGLLGIVVFVFLGWVISENRRAFPWRTVTSGLALQCLLGWLILRTGSGAWF
jgi:concentrative nucleoside transporter, CNT family